MNENERRSTTQILENIVEDVQDIIRSEVRLARAEIKEEALKAAKGGAAIGGAALMGYFALALLVVCFTALLATAMPLWVSAIIMCVVCGCVAGALYAMGRGRLKQVHPAPEKTIRTVKEDLEWARNQMR